MYKPIFLFFIAACVYYFFFYIPKYNSKENFYVDKKIRKFCKDKNMKVAFNPTICSTGKGINRKYDFFRNCKCTDQDNQCTICYKKPKIATIF